MARQARDRLGVNAELVIVPASGHLLDEALVAALRAAIDQQAARP